MRAYVIVSYRERRITVHERGADGAWVTRSAISGAALAIDCIKAELTVDQIYRASSVR